MDITIVDNAELARFEILVDGEVAGFTLYTLHGSDMALTHTETEEGFAGQGLAGQLVRHILDRARERQLAILPYCPFVKSWLSRHREYTDLVPAGRRAQFGL